jgi:hypothetical protein
LTVIDGLGGNAAKQSATETASSTGDGAKPEAASPSKITTAAAPEKPLVVSPPAVPKKPVVVATATPAPAPATTQSISDAADDALPEAAAPKVPVAKKTAAVAAPPVPQAAGAAGQATGAAGYVVVLASVPASNKSRMDALKQFADLQQKYEAALKDKTPDVQEANLGEKGTYHRLLVGPPGSREAASALCTQLKAEGYSGCWVTAY